MSRANLSLDSPYPKRLKAYIDEFPERVSWCHGAARDRFRHLVAHPEIWSVDEVVAAAEEWDSLAVASVAAYGNPTRRLFDLRDIAKAFVELDPEHTALFAQRGILFVRDSASSTAAGCGCSGARR